MKHFCRQWRRSLKLTFLWALNRFTLWNWWVRITPFKFLTNQVCWSLRFSVTSYSVLCTSLKLGDGAFAAEALRLHNSLRSRHGAPPLVLDSSLTKFAQRWAGLVTSNSNFFCWLFTIKERCKKACFQQMCNQGVLGPPAWHTQRCPCFSVVPEATDEASWGTLKGAVPAHKALQGSEAETI